ncbi:LolA family protein [Altericroceibacterium xinjiangense]|uniref:LolA family protein n=1 Tax=Altericroceibacterium xinjiangense TaxID=762261 RepID=UPI000F7D9C77|nr:outer membrane lipoprotein carrier protein LolA [Altericroceibacterium xinjiangense]
MKPITSFLRAPSRAVLSGLLLAAVPATLALPAVPAAAQSSTLDQVVGALRGIKTLQADFTQSDRSGQTLNGKLTLKQPGKIRFDYGKSADMLVVSDGKALTLVDYEVNQVQRWPISNSPLGALLDPNRDVKRYGQLIATSNPNVVSVEVKDPKKPEYGVITLIFVKDPSAPGGLELSSWVALDSQNKRTTVRLSNQKYGVSVPDRAFSFRDPRVTGRRPG